MKTGDVVYLASGGMPLTVISVDAQPDATGVTWATVAWFAGGGQAQTKYPVAALVADDPSPAIRNASDTIASKVRGKG